MKVRAAAIRMPDGVHTLPAPKRHHDIIGHLARQGHPIPIKGEQGFILDDGTFVDREQALRISLAEEQIDQERAEKGPPRLYSEDLW